MRHLLVLTALAALAAPALSQTDEARPQPVLVENRIPPPRDIAYPGTLAIHVDASDTARAIFRVRQTIPVAGAGPLTLLYPEWLAGNHAPRGPIGSIAGLKITGNKKILPWRRNPSDVYAFHIDVPAGLREIEVEFQHLPGIESGQGRILMSPAMLNIQWEKMSFYPAGYFTRNIPIAATVTLPAGWTAATSLDVVSKQGDRITYRPVSYETFVDSPMFAGRHYRREKLAPDVNLNIFADRPENLAAIKPEHLDAHRRLVEQALKVFGAKHYDEYEFLLGLTNQMGGIGLEHLRSSENTHSPNHFDDWARSSVGRSLLAHEFTHSWNGKYRRQAGSWQPTYNMPVQNSLLWVYEGQTQFWGHILSARSGMMPVEDVKAELARVAASYDTLPGRSWRSLADTTLQPIISSRGPRSQPYTSWQRAEDYYAEGMLIWLDVDSIIRERTGGRRSIDDFARAFFGVNPRQQGTLTYGFDDIVSTLNAVAPYDWRGYLTRRVDETGPAPLEWLKRGGYRLVYRDTPTPHFANRERDRGILDLTHMIGATIGKDGDLNSITWDSPFFQKGLTTKAKIVAVNDRAYSADVFKNAISAAKGQREPIRLVIKTGDVVRTINLDYDQGLRYPTLEKIGAGDSFLDRLLAPLP